MLLIRELEMISKFEVTCQQKRATVGGFAVGHRPIDRVLHPHMVAKRQYYAP